MPSTTSTDETSNLKVTLSFKKKLTINDAHIGDEELSETVREVPIIWMPRRNVTPPSVIPKTPDTRSRRRFLLLRSGFLAHG